MPSDIGTDVTPDVPPYTQWGYVKGWNMREAGCRDGAMQKGTWPGYWQDSSPSTNTADATYTLEYWLGGTTWDDHCRGNPTSAANSISWQYELKRGDDVASGAVNISPNEEDAMWKPVCN